LFFCFVYNLQYCAVDLRT